ncbi:hypothetical protein OUZ56_012227 [Daphnia magna]|uniref:Uncharacterized protein n=1 Tax=Daphnia magna TaxID=35525 RepID=A0ABQ9Z2D8_9CRUS|nr:hypothetical protein OUZ56_012227 [Daphnia magna]
MYQCSRFSFVMHSGTNAARAGDVTRSMTTLSDPSLLCGLMELGFGHHQQNPSLLFRMGGHFTFDNQNTSEQMPMSYNSKTINKFLGYTVVASVK